LFFVTTIVSKVRRIAQIFTSRITENATAGKRARVSTSADSGHGMTAATPTAATGSSPSDVRSLDELRALAAASRIEPAADLGMAGIKAHRLQLLRDEIAAKERQLVTVQLQLRDCHAQVREMRAAAVPIYSPPGIRDRYRPGGNS
jgi:hypothetical protein